MNAFSWHHSVPDSDLTLERDEKRKIVKLYRTLGFKIYSLSQPRASWQTPGLPDILGKHPARKMSFTHETKTVKGRITKDQQEFADLCKSCGDLHVIGGYEAGVAFLKQHGLLA